MSISRPGIGGVAAVLLALALVAASAANAVEPVNANSENVAIDGYDTVAYFTQGDAVRGSPAYEHEWQGARWLFSNAEHRDLFADEPARYAPRYGGFCSGGMALGRQVKADPEAWRIIDGRLYLAFTEGAVERFEQQSEVKIPQANANWQELDPAD